MILSLWSFCHNSGNFLGSSAKMGGVSNRLFVNKSSVATYVVYILVCPPQETVSDRTSLTVLITVKLSERSRTLTYGTLLTNLQTNQARLIRYVYHMAKQENFGSLKVA